MKSIEMPAKSIAARRFSLRPERVFLILTCTFGLAVLVANGPFQAPDENDHFDRVFQISEGTLIGEKLNNSAGGDLPIAAIEVTDTEGIPFNYDKKINRAFFARRLHPITMNWNRAPRAFASFPHTVVYPPLGYLPQAVAMFLGRHLRIGPLGLMYMARLAGFAASVALGYAALKVLPFYRWTAVVLLLCPMSLYLFGSIAPDGMVIVGATLLMALLMRLAVEKDRAPDLKEQVFVVALVIVISLTKPPYVTLAGVAMVVVLPRLGSLQGKAVFASAMCLCCLVPLWLWGRIAVALFVPGRGDMPIDPVAQAHHIIEMPFTFIALVGHSLRVQFLSNYQWMVGTLGWGDTPMPSWFYGLFGYSVVGCLLLESNGARNIGWRLRIVMIVAAAGAALLTYAALYSDWNPPGSRNQIEGIEGRYFLPLLPLVVLSFPPLLRESSRFPTAALATILSLLSAGTCLWAVIFRYYVASPASSLTPKSARLINLSTRAIVGNKEHILVSGFAVGGHGKETLLIFAHGPSLSTSGLPRFLARPSLSVLDSVGTVLASNTAWETNSNAAQISETLAQIGAPVLPPNSADAAVMLSIPEGKYTVLVKGADGTSGIVQEEIREVSFDGTRLLNYSSRGYVGKDGNMMVIGFEIRGTGSEHLLGRADGPSLSQFGVIGALSHPTMDLTAFHFGDLVSTAWGSSPARAEIASAAALAGAFPLDADSADSAAVFSLPTGAYTMKIFGVGGTTGVALAEIYELHQSN